MKKILMALGTIVLLSGCTLSIDGNDYLGKQPNFDLEDFFVGEVTAWGIVQNRSGEVVQRFIVDIDGSMDGNTLVLDETFQYIVGDGAKTRVWRLTPQTDGTYIGTAGILMVTQRVRRLAMRLTLFMKWNLRWMGRSIRLILMIGFLPWMTIL